MYRISVALKKAGLLFSFGSVPPVWIIETTNKFAAHKFGLEFFHSHSGHTCLGKLLTQLMSVIIRLEFLVSSEKISDSEIFRFCAIIIGKASSMRITGQELDLDFR